MSIKEKAEKKFPSKNEKETAKEPKSPEFPYQQNEGKHKGDCDCKSCKKRKEMAKKTK